MPDEHDYAFRDFTLRTPNARGETNYDDDAEARREGSNLKIRRQAKSQSAKLWKLLSTYEGDVDNKTRKWMSFANHWIGDNQIKSGTTYWIPAYRWRAGMMTSMVWLVQAEQLVTWVVSHLQR